MKGSRQDLIGEMPDEEQPPQESPVDVDVSPLCRDYNNQPANPSSACCCKCSCSSMKRPSRVSPEPSAERDSKKPNLHGPSLAASSVLPHPSAAPETQSFPTLRRCLSGRYTPPRLSTSLSGFSVTPLVPIPTQSSPPHRRYVSDPYSPPMSSNFQPLDSLVSQPPPEDAEIVADTLPPRGGPSSLPPKPPVRRRLMVDATPSPDKSFTRSPSSKEITREESPHIQRWQRMKDRLKEMNEWLDEIRESEEPRVTKDPAKDENEEEEIEEAVWVEKTGECLVVHFKCPCGKGYQILLSEGKCYYKLM
ncbi:hypothetical protein SLEP1_g16998 [Rubroshorea leprosula]|uniref:Uncharacterized protein n=1 Tax=Rubroshorea leprosula TaxID=152421 RepID=A0AAV5J1K6_9ROSI|nr:hypothetical protein SLEP1_g16998 [Rubroshorea leprosula]